MSTNGRAHTIDEIIPPGGYAVNPSDGALMAQEQMIRAALEIKMQESESLDSQLMAIMDEMNMMRKAAIAKAEAVRNQLRRTLGEYA